MYASINVEGWTWPALWKATEGPPQARVRIVDIDGDGRADYCVIADNGDISCWRNGGQGRMPDYWQPLGVVFTSKGMGDVNGVRFYDLNGDVGLFRTAQSCLHLVYLHLISLVTTGYGWTIQARPGPT